MTTADDLKLIEKALKRARRQGLAYKYGGTLELAADASDALEALERVRRDIHGRQLGLWDKGESDGRTTL